MRFWRFEVELANGKKVNVTVSSKTLSGAARKAYQQYDIESIKRFQIMRYM